MTERRNVSTISIGRSRRASRGQILGVLRGEGEGGEVGVKAPFDVRPQHFDGDGARPGRCLHFAAMHLRDRGGGDRRPEAQEYRFDGLSE